MSKNEENRPQSIVDDLADEYRFDTIDRLAKMSQALRELEALGDDVEMSMCESLDVIKAHAHSIKGTSGTFGFTGLSVVAHTLDDYLIKGHPDDNPNFLNNLAQINELMETIVTSVEIVSDDAARQMLSALQLDTDTLPPENTAKTQPKAMLIMGQGGMCATITRTLEILGLDVTFAKDGVEAIELATVQQPDIILLTLHNERLNAPEVIRGFSDINATSSVPSIVLVPSLDGSNKTDPTHDSEANDLTTSLINELPAGIHTIKQDGKLIRTLSDKLVELGIISL